ncbi:MAG: hypothetical protein R3F14_14190 [Polyangiaceae bacterium]
MSPVRTPYRNRRTIPHETNPHSPPTTAPATSGHARPAVIPRGSGHVRSPITVAPTAAPTAVVPAMVRTTVQNRPEYPTDSNHNISPQKLISANNSAVRTSTAAPPTTLVMRCRRDPE